MTKQKFEEVVKTERKIKEVVLYDSYNAYQGVFDQVVDSILEKIQGGNPEWVPEYQLEVLESIGGVEEVANMTFEELSAKLNDYSDELVCSEDYQDYHEMEKEDTLQVIDQLVQRYENTYKTTVEMFKLGGERYSHYGSIGGNGRTGANLVEDAESFFTLGGDDVIIKINENRELEVTTLDHDGTNTFKVSFITGKEVTRVEDTLPDYEDLDEYIVEKYRSKKPTVHSRRTLKELLGV